MNKIITYLHNYPFFTKIFHTLNYCLKNELKDCQTVLDLGCGPDSPLKYCKNIKYSVGVEGFEPYLEKSKSNNIHSEYISKNIMELDFPENSFDAVIMIEVLEHLPENVGYEIVKKMEKWAKKKIIISSPNGFINQKEVDNNPLQKHLSGWDYKKMEKLGFKCYGLAGFKFLRQEVQNDTMSNNLLTSIRFKPKAFWFIIATLSQIFTYHFSGLAFELFSVKKLKK